MPRILTKNSIRITRIFIHQTLDNRMFIKAHYTVSTDEGEDIERVIEDIEMTGQQRTNIISTFTGLQTQIETDEGI